MFFLRLEKSWYDSFKLQKQEKEKTLTNTRKSSILDTLIKNKGRKRRRRWRYHRFIKNKRYQFNSYSVLKDYSKSNFKEDFKNTLTNRKRKRRKKNKIKFFKRMLWKEKINLTFRKASWKKKKKEKLKLRRFKTVLKPFVPGQKRRFKRRGYW